MRDRFAPGRLDNRCTVPASRTIELERENARLSSALDESNAALAQLQAEFQVLKQQLDWFRRQLFGEKSEKRLDLDPVEQGNLLTGLGVETPPGLDEPSTHTVTYERRSKVRDGAVNDSGLRFDASVPVKTIAVKDPAVEAIPENLREVIGEKVSYRLAQQPGSHVVLKYVRPVVKRKDTLAIVTAAAPGQVLERTAADVSFLAGMLVDKFRYHLPLYRQHQRLGDHGIVVSRSSLNTWASRAIDLLEPVFQAQNANVLQSRVLAMDETSIKAGRKAKGKMRTGWFWPVYGDGDEIVFHFAPSREHRHVRSFLGEFRGTLLTDGYEGYAAYAGTRPGQVIHAQCWSHTRRGFERAKDGEPEAVAEALTLIGAMYRHEKQIRDDTLTGAAKREYRTVHIRPVVEAFWKWCRTSCERTDLLPKNPLAKALNYALQRRIGVGGLPRRPPGGYRHQSFGTSATSDSHGKTKLAVHLHRGRRPPGGYHPESAGHLPAARRGPLHLPGRRTAAHQRASGQARPRTHPTNVEVALRSRPLALRPRTPQPRPTFTLTARRQVRLRLPAYLELAFFEAGRAPPVERIELVGRIRLQIHLGGLNA